MDTASAAATCDNIENSPFVNINDDCLRVIFGYLNVFDAVNVASTCKRLRDFANVNHYHKFIKFELKPHVNGVDGERKVTVDILRTMFQHFGSIIEEIDVHGATFTDGFDGLHLLSLVELSPNLHTLRFRHFQFGELYKEILFKASSSGIKVLELCNCVGLTYRLFNFNELRSLSITSNYDNFGAFFSELKNLNSLELEDCGVSVLQLKEFFKNNGATMRTLKLKSCDSLDSSVFPMITSMMPEIEELTIDTNNVTRSDQLNCLAELDQLKKLVIVCARPESINSCMRLLGNRGLLELLDIYNGTLDAETCGTLKDFQRLQTLRLVYPSSEDEYLMDFIVNADLPELLEFYSVGCVSITNANLVAMVKSKPSLTTVDILSNMSVTFAAVRQIIDVLKSEFDGNRPHLKLNIDTIDMGEEEKIFLKKNQHLITVTNLSKPTKIERLSSIFIGSEEFYDSDDDGHDYRVGYEDHDYRVDNRDDSEDYYIDDDGTRIYC